MYIYDYGYAQGRTERQRLWLCRRSATYTSWRPRTLHRMASKRWLCNLDQQVMVSTAWADGLKHLRPIPEDPVWDPKNWRQWPHLSIAMDLGSDGLCAVMAAMYKYGLNVSMRPDPSHNGCCDFDEALRVCGIKGFWLCMVISWNLPYGLDAEETRGHTLGDK